MLFPYLKYLLVGHHICLPRELGGCLAFFIDTNNRTFMFNMEVGVSIKTLYVEGAHCGAGLDTVLSATPFGTSSSTPTNLEVV